MTHPYARARIITYITLFALSAAYFAFTISYATAQQIDAAGAAQIKQKLIEAIDTQTEIQKLAGNEYQWEGEATVEAAGSYFAITLPYLKIKQADGRKVDVGMIAINTLPSKKEGMWNVAVAMPTPIRIYDKLGALEYQVDVGKQRMNGLWVAEVKQFLKLDGALMDISLKDSQNTEIMAFPALSVKYDFKAVEENIWEGDYEVSAQNIRYNLATEGSTGTIGEVFVKGSAKGMDMMKIKEFQERMENITETLPNDGKTPDFESAEAQESLQDIGLAFFEYIFDFGDSTSSSFGVKDIKTQTTYPAGSETHMFNAKEISAKMDMADLKTNNGSLLFNISLLGLEIPNDLAGEQFGGLEKPYLPDNFAFTLKMAGIPAQDMSQSFSSFMSESMNADTERSNDDLMLQFDKMKQMIVDNDARILLEKTYISSDLYDINIDMDMQIAPTSPYKVKGQLMLSLAGLDKVNAQMQKDSQNTEYPAFAAQIQQAMGMLPMVQMFGQQKEQDGGTVFTYNFDLQEDGQMLLNGNDLSQMMGGGMPQ